MNSLIRGLAFWQTYVADQKKAASSSWIQNLMDGAPPWSWVDAYSLPVEPVPSLKEIVHEMCVCAIGRPSDRRIAFALSEPEAGSDAGMIGSSVKLQGNDYVLNGQKNYVTNGAGADLFLVFAKGAGKTDEEREKLSAFLISSAKKGITKEPLELMGLDEANVANVTFADVRISRDDLIGAAGGGYRIAQAALDFGRLAVADICVGASRKAYESALRHARERRQFGKAIVEFTMIQEKFIEMTERLYAMEAVVSATKNLRDHGRDISAEAAIARIFCGEGAALIADRSLEIAGASGYRSGSPYEKIVRDIRGLRLFGGTDEVLKIFIGFYGSKPTAEYLLANKKGQKGAGYLDAVFKLWFKGWKRSTFRPRPPIVDGKLREAASVCAESAGILAERTFQFFKDFEGDIIEHEYNSRRLVDMAIEVYVLYAVLVRSNLAVADELALRAPGFRASRMRKKIAAWSSEMSVVIYSSDDVEMYRAVEELTKNSPPRA